MHSIVIEYQHLFYRSIQSSEKSASGEGNHSTCQESSHKSRSLPAATSLSESDGFAARHYFIIFSIQPSTILNQAISHPCPACTNPCSRHSAKTPKREKENKEIRSLTPRALYHPPLAYSRQRASQPRAGPHSHGSLPFWLCPVTRRINRCIGACRACP